MSDVNSFARNLLHIACVALVVSGFQCDSKTTSFFLPGATSPQLGNLTGQVASGTTPISGATVALSGAGVRSTTTGSDGAYRFVDIAVGSYNVTTTAAGLTCVTRVLAVQLNQTTTANITCTLLPGSVTGNVRVSGSGQSGVTVTLTQGSTTVGTATTGAGGTYTIQSVPPGSYSAAITPPSGTACTPNPQNVTVQSTQAATADFDCTPLPGSVTGTVRVSGSGQSGIAVTLTQGSTTVGTATTGAGGTFTIQNVPPGVYSAAITAPSGTTCAPNPQNVTVQSSQAGTANFDCTIIPNEFVTTLTNPPPSYRNISAGSSELCTGITTTPAQPGGAWTTTWSGTGTVGVTTRSGTLDATGHTVDRQPINQVGTYNLTTSVTSSGTTRSASGSVVVTAAQGTCLP